MQSQSVKILFQTQIVSRSEVASAALLSYYILSTLGDEVELVWMRPWSFAKMMYLFARYIPWILQLILLTVNVDGTTGLLFTMKDCTKWMIVQAVFLQFIITVVDVILMVRVYVLFDRNKTLLGVLVSLLCGEVGYMTFVLAYITPKLTFGDNCFVTSSPPLFISYWIVSMLYETLLFILTLYKFRHSIKMHGGYIRQTVLRRFVEDGTWAYTLIFVTMIGNLMLYKFVHSPLAGICFNWLLTVLSISGSRLLLNTRKMVYNCFPSESVLGSWSSVTFGDLDCYTIEP